MARGTAYIIGAGDFCGLGLFPRTGDILIAADGGYNHLNKAGIQPDLLIGDMDSIKKVPLCIPRLSYPAKKDDTDMALCLDVALRLGYRRFKLYGALGGRMDHSLANLQLLADLAKKGHQARIIDHNAIVYAVYNGSLALPPLESGRTVSVFSWGDRADGVTLKGLTYALKDATLTNTKPLGVSNEARGKPINISVDSGILIVVVKSRP
ncbi:MAG: thiamine diphosphokinase [Clostridiales bacterium]|nr:thiamine diphosphokinase [Clostridiales bacterium]